MTAGSFDRANYAIYVEGDFDVTDGLLIQAALRDKDFDDFGVRGTYSTRFNAATIGAARIRQIEETTPDTRWNLSGNHMIDSWRLLARVSYYDEWLDSFENDVFGTNAVFDAEMLLDLEVAYDINEHTSILVGGNNVFNNSGQKSTDVNNIGSNSALLLGNTYSQYSPFGISGALVLSCVHARVERQLSSSSLGSCSPTQAGN